LAIIVWISGQQREGVDEGWIAQTIRGLRADIQPICVRVTVVGDDVNVALTAGTCPAGTGAGRAPNPSERALLDLWARCGLAGTEFSPGQLIQCIKRIERAVGT
jgi:hypothetical protein